VALSLAKVSVFSIEELNYLMADICFAFRIEHKRVCWGLSDLYTNELYFILKNTNLSNDEVCGILIGPKCMTNPCVKHTNWTIELQQMITKSIENDDIILEQQNGKQTKDELNFINDNMIESKRGATKETLRVLHLSDLHIDPFYEYGADSNCDEPLCCRSTSAKSEAKAGYWGDYLECDSPNYTIEQLMSHINTTLSDEYQYLIWTGDIVAHDIWNTSRDTIINGSRSLTSLINKYISNGKLVFPVIGNHEGLPVNQ
jgi:sphingomyelin phosphodiesterase